MLLQLSELQEQPLEVLYIKKVFLKVSQTSQENTCCTCNFISKEAMALMFSCEFCEIVKNAFCYRTPPDDCL